MQRLLVPFDSSDNAMRGLEHAIRLAKDNGPIDLVILHAMEPPIIYGEVAIYLPEEKANELQLQHGEEILRPAVEKAKQAGVAFTSKVLIGDVPKSIVACAEDMGCDGIVMGTRGLGAIGNLVLGSVTTKVIHLTKLPVTLVK